MKDDLKRKLAHAFLLQEAEVAAVDVRFEAGRIRIDLTVPALTADQAVLLAFSGMGGQ